MDAEPAKPASGSFSCMADNLTGTCKDARVNIARQPAVLVITSPVFFCAGTRLNPTDMYHIVQTVCYPAPVGSNPYQTQQERKQR